MTDLCQASQSPASGLLWFVPALLWFMWFVAILGRDFAREWRTGGVSRSDALVLFAWLLSPPYTLTIGASGLIFGWLTYLLSRGVFSRDGKYLRTILPYPSTLPKERTAPFGQLEIDGREIQPLDPDQVRREVRRMLAARSQQLLESYRRGEAAAADCPLSRALAL